MRKLIDIPDEQVATLKKLAVDNDVSFKKYLENLIHTEAIVYDDLSEVVNNSNDDNIDVNIHQYFSKNFSKIDKNKVDIARKIYFYLNNSLTLPSPEEKNIILARRDEVLEEAVATMADNGDRYVVFRFDLYTDNMARLIAKSRDYTYELIHDCYTVHNDLNFADNLPYYDKHWLHFELTITDNKTKAKDKISYFGHRELELLREEGEEVLSSIELFVD